MELRGWRCAGIEVRLGLKCPTTAANFYTSTHTVDVVLQYSAWTGVPFQSQLIGFHTTFDIGQWHFTTHIYHLPLSGNKVFLKKKKKEKKMTV